VLQYTGGTTGVPKAAELTHANLTANAEQTYLGLGARPVGTERVLGVLPLFHVFALSTVMILGVRVAAELVLLPRFDLATVLKTIARRRPTMFPAVPTIYSALVEAASRGDVDLRCIEMCMSGGAPLPVEVRQKFMELTGCWLMEGYGLSETSPVATMTPPGLAYKDGSVGQPVLGTTIEIRDPENPSRLLPQGTRGEICVRGPQVMRGYWNRPEDTRDVMIDGALRTGDVGYLDSEGYLFLVDRIKDVIIAGGFNIYPRVLEEALYQHPSVKDAVVIGVPDRYRGQAPKAFVTLKDGAETTPEELCRFLTGYVSKIEMPREVEIRAELPKTMVGKLSKKELVAEETARAERMLHPATEPLYQREQPNV
jgi:long-chain acyl-CoA synthetase